jgi:uncharacterized UPF0160 family protein
MVTLVVKNNVTNDVTGWREALRDAEAGLDKTTKEVASWKATIRLFRKRIAEDASFPLPTAIEHQHSI